MKRILLILLLPLNIFAQPFSKSEVAKWKAQAANVNIIRDNWGIPHVYGKTDADAVFGLLYAQCEDDFKRIEGNYIEKLGRLAEIKGASSLYADLLIRLLIDSTEAKADYKKAPPYLKKLLNAFADGVNYYLYTHPSVKPALLQRFEPWYPLLWTDGSIGAISTGGVSESELESFYSGKTTARNKPAPKEEGEGTGSNGFAFSPSITASGNAILYINPHVTFYFRPEVHVTSTEGLNAYGAVTWGQFFIYQGFNEHCGWMHTSSAVDVADMYAEKISGTEGNYTYEYDGKQKKVKEKTISVQYLENGQMLTKTFTTYSTHHGPIMAERDGKWISVRSHNRSMKALQQSWLRTKAASFAEFKQVMNMRENTSNNTVYADAEGNIAYWHGNFIPVRDRRFNWPQPVDGSTTATEWKGLHTVDESVHLYNPPNGWLQNCNSTPFTVAGTNSPAKKNYPSYMAPDPENFRGINAVRVLSQQKDYTIDKVIAAGYDTYLTAFEKLIPALIKAHETVVFDTIFPHLDEAIGILKRWDYRVAENSIATTLAIEWGEKILPKITNMGNSKDWGQVEKTAAFIAHAGPSDLLFQLSLVITELKKKFGKWDVPWGEINRLQRISSDIDPVFSDDQPSLPVPFVAAIWGMLPSYTTRYFPGTKKRYGVHGNSFICAVEFGKKVKARSLLAGGESGDPLSPHFSDQVEMYSKGQFKEVWFYIGDVMKHVERRYHPGE